MTDIVEAPTPEKPLSPRDKLIAAHKKFCAEARDLLRLKNADYATDTDAFRNFRTFGKFGILVRMHDKLARLRSLLENGHADVSSETVHDTLLDIVNYALLYDEYPEE